VPHRRTNLKEGVHPAPSKEMCHICIRDA